MDFNKDFKETTPKSGRLWSLPADVRIYLFEWISNESFNEACPEIKQAVEPPC